MKETMKTYFENTVKGALIGMAFIGMYFVAQRMRWMPITDIAVQTEPTYTQADIDQRVEEEVAKYTKLARK